MLWADLFAASSGLGVGEVTPWASGIVAVICAVVTYQASHERTRLDKSIGAIEGFDKLTEDQRIELDATKVELKDTRVALREAERIVHAQGFKIIEQEREIQMLRHRVDTLEGKLP